MRFNIQTPQNVLELTSIQNLEKTKDESMQWFTSTADTVDAFTSDTTRMGWMTKLKITLTQINEDYESIMNLTEKLLKGLSIDGWKLFIKQITITCTKTDWEMDKLKQDLYSVLADKCTESQVHAFKNDEKDGLLAYYLLFNSIKDTTTKTFWTSMNSKNKPEGVGEQINKKTEGTGFQGARFQDFEDKRAEAMSSEQPLFQYTKTPEQKVNKEKIEKAEPTIDPPWNAQFKSINTGATVVSDFDKLVADLNIMAKGRGKIKTEYAKDPWTTSGCDPWSESGLTNKENKKSADEPINDGRGFPVRKED